MARGGRTLPAMGRSQQQQGKGFEAAVEYALTTELQSGRVSWFEHTQASFRNVGGRWVAVRAGPADWYGGLAGGLCFALEAKATEKRTLPRSKIRPYQAAHLDRVHRDGGLALLAVQHQAGEWPVYLLPWAAVPWRRHGAGLGLDLGRLAGWRGRLPNVLGPFTRRCGVCRAAVLRSANGPRVTRCNHQGLW